MSRDKSSRRRKTASSGVVGRADADTCRPPRPRREHGTGDLVPAPGPRTTEAVQPGSAVQQHEIRRGRRASSSPPRPIGERHVVALLSRATDTRATACSSSTIRSWGHGAPGRAYRPRPAAEAGVGLRASAPRQGPRCALCVLCARAAFDLPAMRAGWLRVVTYAPYQGRRPKFRMSAAPHDHARSRKREIPARSLVTCAGRPAARGRLRPPAWTRTACPSMHTNSSVRRHAGNNTM